MQPVPTGLPAGLTGLPAGFTGLKFKISRATGLPSPDEPRPPKGSSRAPLPFPPLSPRRR